MFLVFQSRVYQNPQDIDLLFRLDALPSDVKKIVLYFIGLEDEVFLCLKGCTASLSPVQCLRDNCFNPSPVTLRGWSGSYPS